MKEKFKKTGSDLISKTGSGSNLISKTGSNKYYQTLTTKALFDVSQISIIKGLYRGPIYMNIEGRVCSKVTSMSVRWLPFSFNYILSGKYIFIKKK